MKKSFLYLTTALAALAIFAACSKEQTVPASEANASPNDEEIVAPGTMVPITFTAEYPVPVTTDSKTTISDAGVVSWVAGDEVTLYYLEGGNSASTTAVALSDGRSVEFSATIPAGISAIWAAYPAGSGSLSLGGVFTLNTAAAPTGSFADANFAVAYTAVTDVNDISLSFKNAVGIFRVPIPAGGIISHGGESYTIGSVTISGKASDPDFLGAVTVSVNSGTGELEFSSPDSPVTSTSVALNDAARGGNYIYIPSLPITASDGLVFRFTDTAGKPIPAAVTKDGKSIAVERGHIKPSAAVDGIVWDWYFAADGTGDGKTEAAPASIAEFQSLLNATANAYGQWRLDGATLHLAGGNYVLTETIAITGSETGTITIEGASSDNIDNGGSVLNGNNERQIMTWSSAMNLNMSKMRFQNASSSKGAAINTSGATGKLSLDDCVFYHNSSSSHGGAIYLSTSADIAGCKFSTNNSGAYGGAIIIPNETGCDVTEINISGTVFNSNTAATYGGAIANNASQHLTVSDSDFTQNTATSNYGGGLYSNNSAKTFIKGGSFQKNTSGNKYGGAACVGGSSLLYICNAFIGENKVTASSNDGAEAFYGGGSCHLGIFNCTFFNNQTTASTSSAIKAYNFIIANSTFVEGNSGRNSYGVIQNLATSDGKATVINNIVSHNSTNANHNAIGAQNTNCNHILCKYNLLNGINTTNLSAASDASNYSVNGSSDNVLKTLLSLTANDNYYSWSGDVTNLGSFEKCKLSTIEENIKANTELGTAFWTWLVSDDLKIGGKTIPQVDIRGIARDENALWPGSYQQD